MFGYKVSNEDRMFCYLWSDVKVENECKFGERWVPAGRDPEEDCKRRIRESIGVKKGEYDQGDIVVHAIWDVSDIAREVNRYYKQSRMDDFLRAKIGYRKGTTGEIHLLSGEEFAIKVNELLQQYEQKLLAANLSTAQTEMAQDVLNAFNGGSKIVLAELCARFGKTIWSGAVARELDTELVVVASYVKTVFTSFAGDITQFEQFRNYVHVDMSLDGYEEKIERAYENGKKVFAYLSMCNGSKRAERIDYLFSLNKSRMLIIDEADFGVHTQAQSLALTEAHHTNDRVLIMTGTNGDRAVGNWKVDHMVSTTYFQLLVQKKEAPAEDRVYDNGLAHFMTDTGRDKLYPSMSCYQMNIADMAERAMNAGKDEELLPSWSKFGANPLKARGFFTYMLQAIFEGKHDADHLNVSYQTGTASGRRVAMMFLASANNDNLMSAADIARDALPGYEVVVLCGHKDNKINGYKVTNRNAQQLVKEAMHLNENKNILILSNQMAARSFSIPDITELYLAYDNGDNGATVQKMSRTLTPRDLNKVGRVFSLSFDPNRDDKFDAMVMEAALKVKQDDEDIVAAIRRVLKSVDIFECTEDGAELFNESTFIEEALRRSALSRVMGKVADIDAIPDTVVTELAKGKINIQRATKAMRAAMGDTHEPVESGADRGERKASNNDKAKVREMIVTIIENADVIVFGAGESNVQAALKAIEAMGEQDIIMSEFGVPFETIRFIFETGIIKQEWIDIRMQSEAA